MDPNPIEDPNIVDLNINFQGLSISVRGPSSSAAQFISGLAHHSASSATLSEPAQSEPDPSRISEQRSATSTTSETRSSIENSFAACPDSWISLARNQLGGSRTEADHRAKRAWLAGKWARATADGRVSSPNRSETISQRNRYWCVLRRAASSAPSLYTTSADFFRAVGRLEGSTTICHAFPSQVEARIYFAAAETDFPEVSA